MLIGMFPITFRAAYCLSRLRESSDERRFAAPCLLRDVAPCARFDRVFHPFDIALRFSGPLTRAVSLPPFSSARQTKAERSCVSTSAAASTACLGFPLQIEPACAGLRFGLDNEVVAERQREVPPSLAYSIVKVHYLPGGEIKGQDTTCSVRAILSRLDN